MEREVGSLSSFERAAIHINRKVKNLSKQWQAAPVVEEEFKQVKVKERNERQEEREREKKEMEKVKKNCITSFFFYKYLLLI